MEIKKFDFNGMNLRAIVRDGEPWFVAKDVCRVLGTATKDLPSILEDDEKGIDIIDTPGGNQRMTMINESGLYSLILRSRKPEAKAFKKWVTSEVLPAIRKTGGYIPVNEEDTDQEILARALLIAQRSMEEKDRRIAEQDSILKENVTVDRFRSIYVRDYFRHGMSVLLGRLASQICREKGLPIGKEPRTIKTSYGEKDVEVSTYPIVALEQAYNKMSN